MKSTPRWRPGKAATAAAGAVTLLLTGCAGAGGSGSSEDDPSITVLMVGNPQMEDIAELTEEHFTAETGIEVQYTILPENELRDRVTQDVATQGGQYDVATIGVYEAPIWAENGWLHELSSFAEADPEYAVDDLLEPMVASLSGADGQMYAAPFYGESSFLMYNQEMFDEAGLTMPERPTWQEVAEFAAELDDDEAGVSGICLRGLPGWGEVFAPLTTVVNTFGGTWFEEDWTPKVDAPEFTEAVSFYVDLVRDYGQPGAAQSGFTECLNTFGQGQAAMWYDATSAAGSLEDPSSSTVAGNVGYAFAPVEQTDSAGWLWAWAWAMPQTTTQSDAAWDFIAWATSQEYERLVGEELGWSRVPAGKRASTYEIPEYQESAGAFADITLRAIEEADPLNPGLQPRPAIGVQFVGIPEFADLGTKVSQEVAAAIAGNTTVEEALADGQRLAEEVADEYR